MPQTQILSFTALPTAPPPSRCQFASLYQGFPFQGAFWIKSAVGSIQGSRFSCCGPEPCEGSEESASLIQSKNHGEDGNVKLPAGFQGHTFKIQVFTTLTSTLGRYWNILSRGVVKGRLNCAQASSAVSGSPHITQPCILLLCSVNLVGKLIIALSAGFTPSPSSFTISSVPPALLPDSSLARWILYLLTHSYLLDHSVAANKSRPGCLHPNINNVIVYNLKAVSGYVCV